MKLEQWLEREQMPAGVFAERVKVHRTSIYRFIKGLSYPRKSTLQLIMEQTGGKVTPLDFMTPGTSSVDLHERMLAKAS